LSQDVEQAGQPSWLATFRSTIGGTFRFGGRSPNSELIVYVLGAVFFNLAVGLLLMIGLDFELYALVQDGLQVLYFIPVPALLTRRLHDQDRSAKFLWLAVPGLSLWAARKVLSLTQPLSVRVAFDGWTWPIDLLSVFASLTFVILVLLPGSVGPNRFGADQRGRE
jgi:uncharacterized membrane protein YhaH (DUF805 family)